jgi:hypothetical protein
MVAGFSRAAVFNASYVLGACILSVATRLVLRCRNTEGWVVRCSCHRRAHHCSPRTHLSAHLLRTCEHGLLQDDDDSPDIFKFEQKPSRRGRFYFISVWSLGKLLISSKTSTITVSMGEPIVRGALDGEDLQLCVHAFGELTEVYPSAYLPAPKSRHAMDPDLINDKPFARKRRSKHCAGTSEWVGGSHVRPLCWVGYPPPPP